MRAATIAGLLRRSRRLRSAVPPPPSSAIRPAAAALVRPGRRRPCLDLWPPPPVVLAGLPPSVAGAELPAASLPPATRCRPLRSSPSSPVAGRRRPPVARRPPSGRLLRPPQLPAASLPPVAASSSKSGLVSIQFLSPGVDFVKKKRKKKESPRCPLRAMLLFLGVL